MLNQGFQQTTAAGSRIEHRCSGGPAAAQRDPLAREVLGVLELSPELMPPTLDERLVARLAELAARLDGYPEEGLRAEFNRLAGTNIPMEEFQQIYECGPHESYVRRVLYRRLTKPVLGATRAELVEVARRAMPQNEFFDQHEAYMAVFDANVPLAAASTLIFYPPDYDARTGTWGGGQQIGAYDPTPEQIVAWAFAPGGGTLATERGAAAECGDG